MKKAFTLIELLVSVAVLALMMGFASMVFRVSIDMYRVSSATAEIMQKLRAVTNQLDVDFKGLRKDAPILIWFQQMSNADPNRYDEIMFFADGDFSSIQLYRGGPPGQAEPDTAGTRLIKGNTARIFYGQASVNINGKTEVPWNQNQRDVKGLRLRDRILAKRQHIFDPNLYTWPNNTLTDFGTKMANGQLREDRYEHDTLSLAIWKTITGAELNNVIPVSFDNRTPIDTGDSTTLHKLLCEGVSSFEIQWAYWDDLNSKPRFYWFPSTDPDGADGGAQSHFILRGLDRLGVFFNVPGTISGDWFPVQSVEYKTGTSFPSNFFPKALKFTFRLHDSKGVIKDGIIFSHIVYLDK